MSAVDTQLLLTRCAFWTWTSFSTVARWLSWQLAVGSWHSMLRLRPSELTLTPEEVDDAFRRLAQRHAARASAPVASRAAYRNGRPIIRRGPQRSLRDAITILENTSLLIPPPQHAVMDSVDQDEYDDELPAPPGSPRVQHTQATLAHPIPSPGLRSVQLPFRNPSDHAYALQQATRDQIEQASTQSIVESPQRTLSATNSSPLRDSDSSFRPNTPTDIHAELRGGAGGDRPGKDCACVVSEHAALTPSPLCREHTLKFSSYAGRSPDPVKAPITPASDQPIRHLQGYFKSPNQEPRGISYHFAELIQYPNSEPRPRTSRQQIATRSLSSDNTPTFSSHLSRPGATASSDEGVFGTLAGSSNRMQVAGPSMAFRPRQSSSEISGASAAYSYYGSLPSGSRHSSSGQSAIEVAHHRVRSLGYSRDSLLSPPITSSKSQSPNSSQVGHMPPNPSEQRQSLQSTLQPSPSSQQHDLLGGFPDATEAAAKDLRSPLDDYSEQYQRLNRAQPEQEILPYHMRASRSHPLNNATSSRSTSGGGTNRKQDAARLTVPLEQGVRGYPRPPPPPVPSPLLPSPTQPARANQRSSGQLSLSSPATNNCSRGQVQTQRAAYELLQNASRAMQTISLRAPRAVSTASSMSPPSLPRDTSNRDRFNGSHPSTIQPLPFGQEADLMASSPPSSNPSLQRPLRLPGPSAPSFGSTAPPRDGPPGPRRTHRQVSTTTAPSLHLQLARHSPPTSLALDHGSGVTSRRPRSPPLRIPSLARTHRRVPAHQQDQENSAEVEISAMQREEAAFHARYGDVEQQDTMNDTPPRMGRAERGIFE